MILYPKANWRPVPAHGGVMSAHLGLILHVQVGSNSCYPEFNNVANKASSTWWVSKSGTIEQYVDANEIAWAEAQGNAEYDSVETEGLPSEPLTDAQIHSLAELYAWGHTTFGWPIQLAEKPGDQGLGWHGMGAVAWGNHPNCPGDLRKAQRKNILEQTSNILAPPIPATRITVIELGDVKMQWIDFNSVTLDVNGNGWEWCDAPHDKILGFKHWGSFPPVDGYWPIPKYASQERVQEGHQSVIEIQGGGPNQLISFSVLVDDAS